MAKQHNNKKKYSNDDYPDEDKIHRFILCLYYLNQEAERENLSGISNAIRHTIHTIENNEIQDLEQYTLHKVVRETSYYALEFLNKFSSLSKERQRALAFILDDDIPL